MVRAAIDEWQGKKILNYQEELWLHKGEIWQWTDENISQDSISSFIQGVFHNYDPFISYMIIIKDNKPNRRKLESMTWSMYNKWAKRT